MRWVRRDRVLDSKSGGVKQITRIFNIPLDVQPPEVYALTVSLAGSGTGSVTANVGVIDCPGTCTDDHDAGSAVILTATPDSGSTFTSWSGACSGVGVCEVIMDQARSVTAIFDVLPPEVYALTVGVVGNGTVTSDEGEISCPATCASEHDAGTIVTLTATPDTGSAFAGWSGACIGIDDCQVTMGQAQAVTATFDIEFTPGNVFRGCAECPQMIVIPAGTFMMGDIAGVGFPNEVPVHQVSVPSFAAGVFEVTWDEWEACVSDSACDGAGVDDDYGLGRGTRPVIRTSWNDAQEYVTWLSQLTGQSYRLLTEAEWEYVTRAGTSTKYWWGDHSPAGCDTSVVNGARFGDTVSNGCEPISTDVVGTYETNPFGLYDVHGNVWEWVEDCHNTSYTGAPVDGSAWLTGDCSVRGLRGGGWLTSSHSLRSAQRNANSTTSRSLHNGFRVARDR